MSACSRTPSKRATPIEEVPIDSYGPPGGSIAIAGLSNPVSVVRDQWGIRHITAQSEHDLFVAQGFIQAGDRLFQMDLWRRSAQGRLSEVLGPNFVDRDAMTRRMQYHGDLNAEWASYGPGTKAIAEAFVTGINAWVVLAKQDLPREFALAGWKPELWTPEDLLNRTDAFLSSGDAALEALRLQIAGAADRQRAAMLLPGDLPQGLPRDADLQKIGEVLSDALRRVGTTPFFTSFGVRLKADTTGGPTTGGQIRGSGSNVWALAGSRTATGAPLLASDPHRPLTNPPQRYLVHLKAPGWNVIGATSPWLPGVVIGHNDRMAWGMAARDMDTQDIHVEPASAVVERMEDPIVVKGRDKPFAFVREYTRTGVVIGSDRAHGLVFTLTWSGFEPGNAAELGALSIDRAMNAADMRSALARWKMPAVDVVYADASGIGPSRAPFVIAANGNAARTNRINEMLSGGQKFTVEDLERQQHDVVAWNAEQLVPRLAALRSKDPRVEEVRQTLVGWDRRVTADSEAARRYVAFERALWRRISEARVPASVLDDYLGRVEFNLNDALKAGNAVLLDALSAAAGQVPPAPQITFRHPLAITQETRGRYNVGPFQPGGYASTVNAYSSRANVDVGASFRMIADVGDWDRSVAISAPGQAEWPGKPHFSDLATPWASGEYFPLLFSDPAIMFNSEWAVTLQPR